MPKATTKPELLKDKLVAVKQAWARAGRLLTGTPDEDHANRLPPGQRLVTNWPVLDLGIQPDVPRADWRLTVDGAVVNPIVWAWDDLMAQPVFEDVSDIHCVTQWSRYDNRWQGVSAQHLLSVVQPLPTCQLMSCCTAMMAIPPMSGSIILPMMIACWRTAMTARRLPANMAGRCA